MTSTNPKKLPKITPKYIQNAQKTLDDAKKAGIPFTETVQRSFAKISYDLYMHRGDLEREARLKEENIKMNERIKSVSNLKCISCHQKNLVWPNQYEHPICELCGTLRILNNFSTYQNQ